MGNQDSSPTNVEEPDLEAEIEDQQPVAGAQDNENSTQVDPDYQLTRDRLKRQVKKFN